MAESPTSSELLRQYMSPAVRGAMVDAILAALGTGDDLSRANSRAVFGQLSLTSASGRYLDRRAGNAGFLRPEGVGLPDSVFRTLAIVTAARKQVVSVLLDVMEVFYTAEGTRAFATGTGAEPYPLADGDVLSLVLDGRTEVSVVFAAPDFTSIGAATAAEVAAAVTRQARTFSPDAFAVEHYDYGSGDTFVRLFSGAKGPVSSVQVTGGRAQAVLRFPAAVPTTQTPAAPATEWGIAVQPSGSVWLTWAGGTDPSLGRVAAGDYVSIFGAGFRAANRGSFAVEGVADGPVGTGHVAFANLSAVDEPVPVAMAADTDVEFWAPVRSGVMSRGRYATVFEADPGVISAFLPATTTVTGRGPTQAAYVHDPLIVTAEFLGPYAYDPSAPFVVSEVSTASAQALDAGQSYGTVAAADSSPFPDGVGFLVFGYGTALQEGPVRYLGRPGGQILVLDPSYRFLLGHPAGSDVSLVSRLGPPAPAADGGSYQLYATGTSAGRIYAERLLGDISAAGVALDVTVLYPGDAGLGNQGLPKAGARVSDAVYVWGGDPP